MLFFANDFSHAAIAEVIERLLRMAARARQPVSLSILDIDNFKTINDEHGHPAGDAVLRGVGAALHRFLRGDDVAELPLRDEVWPKFLRTNALKVLGAV